MTTRTNGRRAVLTAALTVAAGAGVATAHGLYEVAVAAGVPVPVAWLYPLITDGLALVAYAAATRLHSTGRRYAAAIVVLAAGLSGLAQAINLAGGIRTGAAAPAGLRFGVGAWPAIAAALTAHLLHLIGTDGQPAAADSHQRPSTNGQPVYNQRLNPPVQPRTDVQPDGVQPDHEHPELEHPQPVQTGPVNTAMNTPPRGRTGGAAERARQAGRDHHHRHGHLPTVTELVDLAQVSRGTASKALSDLKAERPPLHIVNDTTTQRTET